MKKDEVPSPGCCRLPGFAGFRKGREGSRCSRGKNKVREGGRIAHFDESWDGEDWRAPGRRLAL